MSEFKVGDRIKVVACTADRVDYTGHEGTIRRVTGWGSVLVSLDNHIELPIGHYGFYFSEEELEVIE